MQLPARVAVVTGAGSGIGRAIADAFCREGAHVVCADIDPDRAEATAARVGSPGARALAVQVDVADSSQVEQLRERTLERFAKVDILCNNAGVLDGYHSVTETSEEEWDRTVDVNLKGAFLVSRAFIPTMLESGGGAIVNTASTSSFMPGGGGAAYVASKHGLLGLTRQLAMEYGSQGIRVNAICPGVIKSEMTRELSAEGGADDAVMEAIKATPGRPPRRPGGGSAPGDLPGRPRGTVHPRRRLRDRRRVDGHDGGMSALERETTANVPETTL